MGSPFHPFSVVPPEIISQLFLAYHATPDNASLSGLRSICLTCKDWRDIAYSTSELWSMIDLHLRDPIPIMLVDNLRTLLERSHEHPLTVVLRFHCHVWRSVVDRDRATQFMTLLLDNVHRWKVAHLEFQCESYPSFHMNTVRTIHVPHNLISMVASSPKLRTRRDIGSQSHVHGLLYFKNITSLEITLPPQFSMLKSLNLSLATYSSLQSFLSGIHVPNLEELEFHFAEFSSFGSHMKSIKNFLKTTSGQITSFSIRNMCIQEEDLLECLAILSPSLQRLRILADPTLTAIDYYAIENVTERTLEALTYDPEQEPLCPQLEHLTLERCIQATDGALSDMVDSRWRQHSELNTAPRLRFLRAVFRYHTHPIDARLDCQIRYGSMR
ncbi:hypothetical protein CPB84DRAFT_1761590 [Gymnopilus junonius]|uniref:F-box domain-containing protein n=1 Tax=Gymnopilus junonius TaxID=109634 RepID=A0A9P5NZS3_GYMJU|nr:hypothetical protein CPB84DRAFT_1761590 [Gymnopilus junonius]